MTSIFITISKNVTQNKNLLIQYHCTCKGYNVHYFLFAKSKLIHYSSVFNVLRHYTTIFILTVKLTKGPSKVKGDRKSGWPDNFKMTLPSQGLLIYGFVLYNGKIQIIHNFKIDLRMDGSIGCRTSNVNEKCKWILKILNTAIFNIRGSLMIQQHKIINIIKARKNNIMVISEHKKKLKGSMNSTQLLNCVE